MNKDTSKQNFIIDESVDDIHFIPNDTDNVKHESSKNCWCKPVLSYTSKENGFKIWTHKESDILK